MARAEVSGGRCATKKLALVPVLCQLRPTQDVWATVSHRRKHDMREWRIAKWERNPESKISSRKKPFFKLPLSRQLPAATLLSPQHSCQTRSAQHQHCTGVARKAMLRRQPWKPIQCPQFWRRLVTHIVSILDGMIAHSRCGLSGWQRSARALAL